MPRYTAVAIATLLISACGPTGGATPGASPSPAASAKPSPAASAAATPVVTPAASAKPAATAVPVAVKLTMNGKPATIKAFAYPLPQVLNSTYWNIGKLADSGEANIGQGYGILAEGEGNVTLHMKMPDENGLRTLTDAEYKGAANMTYKEGPKCLTWYANGQTAKAGGFKVEGATATFTMTAEIAGNKRENDGTARSFEIEISGLPLPGAK